MGFRGASGWVTGQRLFVYMAIENLDYIRRLIEQVRTPPPGQDAQKLRMINGTGVGTNQITQKQGAQ